MAKKLLSTINKDRDMRGLKSPESELETSVNNATPEYVSPKQSSSELN